MTTLSGPHPSRYDALIALRTERDEQPSSRVFLQIRYSDHAWWVVDTRD